MHSPREMIKPLILMVFFVLSGIPHDYNCMQPLKCGFDDKCTYKGCRSKTFVTKKYILHSHHFYGYRYNFVVAE